MSTTTLGVVAACVIGAFALSFLAALVIGPVISTRRQDAARARVDTYVRRQEQARQADADGRPHLAAALRGYPNAGTIVDPEAIVAELEADARDGIAEAFDRAELHTWQPAQVSGTGHLEVSTAVQPAAVVERTGVVLELYPPKVADLEPLIVATLPARYQPAATRAEQWRTTPKPTPHPRPAGSDNHPAGRHAGYYGNGPGGCPVCGWHLRIDGHAPRCTRAAATPDRP